MLLKLIKIIIQHINEHGSKICGYDAMNRLIKVTLYKIDTLHKVNEEQVTFYQYDKRGLVVKEINAMDDSVIYIYDGCGNLIQKTDQDGYVTVYGYDPRNIVEAINYADGRNALFIIMEGQVVYLKPVRFIM